MKHRWLAGLSAFVVILGGTGQPVAWADDRIVSQPFVVATGLDQLKAEGFDGRGVTIAVIDTRIDLSVPELAGADIEVRATCETGSRRHATGVVSLLANQVWGWAPKAHYHLYAVSFFNDLAEGCEGNSEDMIHRAINDGADIISISGGTGEPWWTLIRAALRGIPIVIGSGNDAEVLYPPLVMGYNNTLVNVGATDMSGVRSPYSQYGPGLTVVAPGNPIACRGENSNGDLTFITYDCWGTSLSTPMVSGALALAMQAWPQAHGNQLIASLIASATRHGDGWNEEYGWGNLDAIELVHSDPSQFSTDSPLIDAIPGRGPTFQHFQDYINHTLDTSYGSVNPLDTDYQQRTFADYQGYKVPTDPVETPTPPTSPSDEPVNTPTVSRPWAWIVGGIVLLGVLVMMTAVLIRRRSTQ
ncbi:MAG: S8 family serine peptidase [Propionibacteriaceae bacterium]|jgi:subtilisin family serine protease|nr:S8 family serine peptidase [Propionibacteriaceae bacterium]